MLYAIMADSLAKKKCVPCEGGVKPLSMPEAKKLLSQLGKGWKIGEGTSGLALEREVKLEDFKSAMLFLNAVAHVAECEGHHPDFEVHYNKIKFRLYTHSTGGLHLNDFILASKIDALLSCS